MVNHGTALAEEDRPQGTTSARAFRGPRLSISVASSDTTEVGGLALAARLVSRLRIAQRFDKTLSLLKVHGGYYFESDHVLTHAYDLFTGATGIEDVAHLQQSEPVRQLLGAEHIPDPTTAGDFLRRFGASDIDELDRARDAVRHDVWKLPWPQEVDAGPRRRRLPFPR